MVKVATYGCCTNERNVYDAEAVRLVLDTPAYETPQVIVTIPLTSFMSINRVNKVNESTKGLLIVHIA